MSEFAFYLDIPVENALERLQSDAKPDFWECGLDYRMGKSIGQAYARYQEQRPPADVISQHFLEHQSQALRVFREVLPDERARVLDGCQAPEDLLDDTLRELADYFGLERETGLS